MKVLLAITKPNFGGAQRYVYDLALGAYEAGHAVTVLTGSAGILTEKLASQRIETLSLPSLGRDVSMFKDFQSLRDILSVIKRERPAVLHLNSSKMGFFGSIAGRLMGVRCIIFTAHG